MPSIPISELLNNNSISFTQLINDEALDIDILFDDNELKLTTDGLEAILYVNKKENIRRIHAGTPVALEYNPQKLIRNPRIYVCQQLKAHQDHYSFINQRLLHDNKRLGDFINAESYYEAALKYIPLAKVYFAIDSWARFGISLKQIIGHAMLNSIRDAVKYKLTESIIRDGKNFVSNAFIESKGRSKYVRDRLIEWGNVQGDLLYVYSRIVENKIKSVKSLQRSYELLYPRQKA